MKTTTIAIRLNEDDLKALQELSRMIHTNQSELIRLLIRHAAEAPTPEAIQAGIVAQKKYLETLSQEIESIRQDIAKSKAVIEKLQTEE